MITTLLLLCLTLLDILPTPKPDNLFGKQFVVNDSLDNSAMTGCATSPQAGRGPNNHFIEVDFVNNNDPHDGTAAVSTLPADYLHGAVDPPIVPVMKPYDPTGTPENPQPETPPVAATPEPPTAAILAVSAGVLLYLLFGRRKRERLYRRI